MAIDPLQTPNCEGRASRKRGQAASHSRRALIWALGAFFVGQLGLRTVIELWAPQLRDPTFEVKAAQLQIARARAEESPFTIVFLGSSETANGVHSERLSQLLSEKLGKPVLAYNLGTPGSGPLTYLLNLNRLLRRGTIPDVVVLEAAPRHVADFSGPWDAGHFSTESLAYRDLGLIRRYGGAPRKHIRREWWVSFFAPSYANRQAMLTYLCPELLSREWRANTWSTVDESGWMPFPKGAEAPDLREKRLANIRTQFSSTLAAFRHGGENYRLLFEAVDKGRRFGVNMLVWVPPEGPTMRQLYAGGSLDALWRDLKSDCEKRDAALINSFDWCPEDHFADAIHLLPEPALLAADRIAAALESRLKKK